MSEIFNFEKSPLEELRDLLPGTDGFAFGTSPHGLSADLRPSWQETRERPLARPSAKPLLPFGETQPPAVEMPSPVSGTSDAVPLLTFAAATPRAQQPVPLPADAGSTARSAAGARTEQHGEAERSGEADSPGVYHCRKVRSACRFLRAAVAKLPPKDVHYLRLTEVEFLHVYAAVDNDRSRTLKAIRKGIADPQDLKASDSLWHALQDVQSRRLRKAWRLP